jgi:hypothetical protein
METKRIEGNVVFLPRGGFDIGTTLYNSSDRLDKVTPAHRAGAEPPHLEWETGPYLYTDPLYSTRGPCLYKVARASTHTTIWEWA